MARHSERLSPWLDALKSYVTLPQRPAPQEVDEAQETGVVWLRWTQFPPPTDEQLPRSLLRAYEALELLALLIHVDYEDWMRVIAHLWPRGTQTWINALNSPKLMLGVEVRVSEGGLLTRWARRAWDPVFSQASTNVFALASATRGYAAMRHKLMDALRGRGMKTATPVLFVLQEEGPDEVSNFLSLQLETRELVRHKEAHMRSFFRLIGVRGEDVQSLVTIEEVFCADQIAASGVPLASVDLFSLVMFEHGSVEQDIARLHRLMATSATPGYAPVDGIVVDSFGSDQTLDAIFSALYYCPTVRTVRLTGNATSVSPSVVCASCTGWQVEDIRELERTLRSGISFSTLFPNADVTGEVSHMVVTASMFLLSRPHHSTQPLFIGFAAPIEKLKVIGFEGAYVRVLLPGWGQAWVRRSDVCSHERVIEVGISERKSHHVRRLVFYDLSHRRLPILLEFLRVVGAGIQVISIKWDDNIAPPSNDWIRNVCVACPDLVDPRLDLRHSGALNVLTECYNDGICHATRLLLNVLGMDPNPPDNIAFSRCLGDPCNELNLHLRDLTLAVNNHVEAFQIFRLLPDAAAMLKRNRTLWNLDMEVDFGGDHVRMLLDVREFESFDNQLIPVRVAPLPIKNKVAFLSVLGDRNVDTFVVSRIFQFAVETKKRRVQVTIK